MTSKIYLFWSDLSEAKKKEMVELLGENAYLYFPFTMIITDERMKNDDNNR